MTHDELERHFDRIVSEWPPLSDNQLDHIAALLRTGDNNVAAELREDGGVYDKKLDDAEKSGAA